MKRNRVVSALDIGEVSKLSGLPASTIRFYEEKRLIQSTGRHGLRRLFSPRVLEQLEFIALGRHAGFTLEEISSMLSRDGHVRIDPKQLLSKSDQIDKSIKLLSAIRDGLRHAANCAAPTHFECPKFQRLLRVAGKRQSKARKA